MVTRKMGNTSVLLSPLSMRLSACSERLTRQRSASCSWRSTWERWQGGRVVRNKSLQRAVLHSANVQLHTHGLPNP